MLDTILVAIILIAAVTYFVYSQVKKFKRLSTPTEHGGCGGHCENCPFAGDCGHKLNKPKKPSGGCGCGCGG